MVPASPEAAAMRTTIALDDALLEEARELTDIKETSALVREGLTALVQREAARRLALLGGTMPDAQHIPRRRPEPAEPDAE
jgi:Arc/MetJ family transcription regulator